MTAGFAGFAGFVLPDLRGQAYEVTTQRHGFVGVITRDGHKKPGKPCKPSSRETT